MITKSMARQVCGYWGEDAVVGGQDGGEDHVWDATTFLKLVVEPCMKHGWGEETKVGSLCCERGGNGKAKNGENAPTKSVADSALEAREVPHAHEMDQCKASPTDNDYDGNADGDGLLPMKEQDEQEKQSELDSSHKMAIITDKSDAAKGKGLNKGPSGTSPVGNYLSGFISLVNDPRHPYYATYTVEHLGSVRGGQRVLYVNVPSNDLLGAVAYAIGT